MRLFNYINGKWVKSSSKQKFLSFIDEVRASEDVGRFFKDWLIVSQVEFAESVNNLNGTELPWLHVRAEHAVGVKCPRCWQWDEAGKDLLCARCKVIIK